jgi:hypothetical protein
LKSKIEVLVGYWSRAIAIGGRGYRALTHIRLRRSGSLWAKPITVQKVRIYRVTTGISEGINRAIKGLKWQAYGYKKNGILHLNNPPKVRLPHR